MGRAPVLETTGPPSSQDGRAKPKPATRSLRARRHDTVSAHWRRATPGGRRTLQWTFIARDLAGRGQDLRERSLARQAGEDPRRSPYELTPGQPTFWAVVGAVFGNCHVLRSDPRRRALRMPLGGQHRGRQVHYKERPGGKKSAPGAKLKVTCPKVPSRT
ncbi:hypothetical protein C2E23DRAFT_520116 [Lenzites betulinus]|nr:hypothetical protein C2E23DRAFT_520116 [Lenzites betulinus]